MAKFDWGEAGKGAVKGATTAAPTGDPLAIIAAALGYGALSGFTGKKEEGDGEGDTGGFDMSKIFDMVLQNGGQGNDVPSAPMPVNPMDMILGGAGSGEDLTPKILNEFRPQAQAPQLIGFPSLQKESISSVLKRNIAARRGY